MVLEGCAENRIKRGDTEADGEARRGRWKNIPPRSSLFPPLLCVKIRGFDTSAGHAVEIRGASPVWPARAHSFCKRRHPRRGRSTRICTRRVCATSVTYAVHPSGSCAGSVRGGAGFGLHTLCDLQRYFMKCPRRESNPHHRFRKPAFYPLNYGDFFLSAIYGVFDMPQRRTKTIN